jgi:hypothetical protein
MYSYPCDPRHPWFLKILIRVYSCEFVVISYTPALLGNPVVARVSRAKEFAADTAAATARNSPVDDPSAVACVKSDQLFPPISYTPALPAAHAEGGLPLLPCSTANLINRQ